MSNNLQNTDENNPELHKVNEDVPMDSNVTLYDSNLCDEIYSSSSRNQFLTQDFGPTFPLDDEIFHSVSIGKSTWNLSRTEPVSINTITENKKIIDENLYVDTNKNVLHEWKTEKNI